MLKLNKFYRTGNINEQVITSRVLENGIWTTITEPISSNVTNNQTSKKAAVFGNGQSRAKFDPNWVINKKSGLLGSQSLQTYGCNAFFRQYTPDFMIITNRELATEAVTTNYAPTNIVYTRLENLVIHPSKFYVIPFDPYTDAGTTAIYLAAYDGHKTIYLVGFNGQDPVTSNDNMFAGTSGYDEVRTVVADEKWVADKLVVFNTYDDVDFVFVSETGRVRLPESWKYCTNLRQINFRQMVLEADL